VLQLFFYISLLINDIKNVLIHFVKKLLLLLNVVLSYLSLFLNALLEINLQNNKTSKQNETILFKDITLSND